LPISFGRTFSDREDRDRTAPTSDVTAFDLYNRAKNILLTTSFNANVQPLYFQAVELLNQAIARDPSSLRLTACLAYLMLILLPRRTKHNRGTAALAEDRNPIGGFVCARSRRSASRAPENLYRGIPPLCMERWTELEIARRTLPNDSRVPELIGYIVRRPGKRAQFNSLRVRGTHSAKLFHHLADCSQLSKFASLPEMAAMLDRALAITRENVEIGATRGISGLDGKLIPAVHQTIESTLATDPEAIKKCCRHLVSSAR